VSDRGEIIVFAGTDPDTQGTWTMVGVFNVPEPLGTRCFRKAGADLVLLTKRGPLPLTQVVTVTESGQVNTAITGNITPTFELAARTFGTQTSWQLMEIPNQNLFLVNVPQGAASSVQYVMSAETGGWSLWTGINAAV